MTQQLSQAAPEDGKTTIELAPSRKGDARKARYLVLPPTISVKQLAEMADLSAIDVIKQLMRNGIMASVNQIIDFDVALLVTSAFGVRARPEQLPEATGRSDSAEGQVEDPSQLQPRPPVVAILGHVDHGKTSLLDVIRRARVADTEVGHITQHIGAYQVLHEGKKITFLDTPGHEAFTAIRARGARATDIVVLVVAADDGVMPQTLEAADHARAAGVPIIVAINKIDRLEAALERTRRQLADRNMLVEEWGGNIISVPVSAVTEEGISALLESILLVAEVAELKANPERPAQGVVIEAKLDRTKGPLATVLVQHGTLRVGDYVVAGKSRGRVKALADDMGKPLQAAAPADPAEIMGFGSLPEAGDIFTVVPSDKASRAAVEEKLRPSDGQRARTRMLGLEDIYTGVSSGEIKGLNVLLKADVQGSVEAVCSALERLDEENIKVRILHAASGTVTESDVMLARASSAIILGFNTSAEPGAERLAEREAVEIRHYNIIYHLIEEVEKALKGMLEPVLREVVIGQAEVRAVFSISRGSTIAGCMVTEGRVTRNTRVRVLREGQTLHEGLVASLRHFKNNVTEVTAGFECGIGLAAYTDFQEGDILEAYRRESVRS